MSHRDAIIQQALALPPEDRAYVALVLEHSINEDGQDISGDAFLEELKQRSAAYRSGTTTARDASDVMNDLRARQADEPTI